jgi:hypothetical protein
MNKRIFLTWVCATFLAFAGQVLAADESKPPNLLIIQTDEHNFRMLLGPNWKNRRPQ